MDRECMEFDVVIVGAGPAGLSTACKLAQLAKRANNEPLTICVVEKGAEIGAHILSGALFETSALDELFPEWPTMNAPLTTPVNRDQFLYLTNQFNYLKVPHALTPKTMRNSDENYVISLSSLCRWLAQQAETLGVEVFPGFAAATINYDKNGTVTGINTSDMGLDKNGEQKPNFEAGIELKAKYTIFAEGARGHLGKQLIKKYQLDAGKQPQHYALGLKEVWEVPESSLPSTSGDVFHTIGWPLNESDTSGGGFLYHLEGNKIAVGLVVDLNYSNPYLSPFDEFQRLKHHPAFSRYLEGGQRITYGARAIAKGGMSALPKQQFPGGLLIGCDAGTLNVAKIKGCHTAMKSGMLAAEAVFKCLSENEGHQPAEPDYDAQFKTSWLYQELEDTCSFSAAIHKYGNLLGGALITLEHNVWIPLFNQPEPWVITDRKADHLHLKTLTQCQPITYPKPDGVLSFDKPSSVYLSSTQHEENQPCHLVLADSTIPIQTHLPYYAEPAQRYCPAGVYEIISVDGKSRLQINAANCIHCKTCDIKDPSQNITWISPEGGGGPNYRDM